MAVSQISSRDNPRFKALKQLATSAAAIRQTGQTVLAGAHLVQAALAAGIKPRQLLLCADAPVPAEVARIVGGLPSVPVIELAPSLFKDICQLMTPDGIAAVIDIPPAEPSQIGSDTLVLDGIQDAGNVGTMLRTAAAAGVADVVLGAGCAGAWTAKVLRAGQGAHFSLCIQENVELVPWLKACDLPRCGAVAEGGLSLYESKLESAHVWIFGSEGQGISTAVETLLTRRISIPMAMGVESLNVAAAAAICLFEARRQRLEK